MNEYALLKEMKMKPREGAVGLDDKNNFDDYTIYDEGQIQEKFLAFENFWFKSKGAIKLKLKSKETTMIKKSIINVSSQL